MEARLARIAVAGLCVAPLIVQSPSLAAGYRTRNFSVSAPTPQLAQEIGEMAERYRKEMSVSWIGEEMPPWSKPCPIHARVSPGLGAGGATSFVFDQGEVFGWRMKIQGSRELILNSVLPHEVTHTIFACYFRQPLPRWADEGACTTVEHPSEIAKQERMLIQFLKQRRGIPFGRMFAMKEYPRDVMPLYSQGHSLAQMLIESRGRRAFLNFLSDGLQDENWPRAVQKHYGHKSLFALQESWLNWVKSGRPRLGPETDRGIQVAAVPSASGGRSIYRGQSPDPPARPPTQAVDVRPIEEGQNSVYAAMAAQAAALQSAKPSDGTQESVYEASSRRSPPRRY